MDLKKNLDLLANLNSVQVVFNAVSAKDLHLSEDEKLLDPNPIERINAALGRVGSDKCLDLTTQLFKLWVKAAIRQDKKAIAEAVEIFGKNFSIVLDDERYYEIISHQGKSILHFYYRHPIGQPDSGNFHLYPLFAVSGKPDTVETYLQMMFQHFDARVERQ